MHHTVYPLPNSAPQKTPNPQPEMKETELVEFDLSQDAFLQAIREQDINKIKACMSVDAYRNYNTLLLAAVETNDCFTAQWLFKKENNKPSPDAILENGDSCLHIAVRNKNDAMLTLLLQNGANPYSKNKQENREPVRLAAYEDYFEGVYILINFADEIKEGHKSVYEGVLLRAVTQQNPKARDKTLDSIIKRLVNKHDISPDSFFYEDKHKDTTLHAAVRNGDTQTLTWLVQKWPERCHLSLNADSETPMQLAAKWRRFDYVNLMLDNLTGFLEQEQGIPQEHQFHYGKILYLAIMQLKYGYRDAECDKTIDTLLERHVSLQAYQDEQGYYSLHAAVASRNSRVLEELLEYADVEKKSLLALTNNNGETPVVVAALENHFDLVKILIDNDKPINPKNYSTVLYLATEALADNPYLSDMLESIISPLITSGVSLSLTHNERDVTPLHAAARIKNPILLDLFLSRLRVSGEKNVLSYEDSDGLTVMQRAASGRFFGGVNAILDFNESSSMADEQKIEGPDLEEYEPVLMQVICKYHAANPVERREGMIVIKRLLEKNIPIEPGYEFLNSSMYPLHVIASYGDVELFKLVLNHVTDLTSALSKCNSEYLTPLGAAAKLKNWDVVMVIYQKMGQLKESDHDNHAGILLEAVRASRLDIVKWLLVNRNVPMTARDEWGNHCMHVASSESMQEFLIPMLPVELLLSQNKAGKSPLEGCFSCNFELLFGRYLGIFCKNPDVVRPILTKKLESAVRNGEASIVKMLLDADVRLPTDHKVLGGLIFGALARGHADILAALFNAGYDPNAGYTEAWRADGYDNKLHFTEGRTLRQVAKSDERHMKTLNDALEQHRLYKISKGTPETMRYRAAAEAFLTLVGPLTGKSGFFAPKSTQFAYALSQVLFKPESTADTIRQTVNKYFNDLDDATKDKLRRSGLFQLVRPAPESKQENAANAVIHLSPLPHGMPGW